MALQPAESLRVGMRRRTTAVAPLALTLDGTTDRASASDDREDLTPGIEQERADRMQKLDY